MRKGFQCWIAGLLLASALATAVLAQNPEFVMRRAGKFTDDDATPQIIGGSKADPAEWPATFIFQGTDGGRCTSTAVGPQAMLTAAHCIKDKAMGIVEVNGKEISATCYQHPDYHSAVLNGDKDWEKKVSPDFALCILVADLKTKDYENVNTSKDVPTLGATIHLLGFGCNKEGGTDKGFGVLYEGDSAAKSTPTPPSYYTTTLGGAAICFGDSGGGAYIYLNQTKTRRSLVGVNSRGDISTKSLLSTTGVPGFVAWATSLADKNRVKICGLHSDAKDCRPK